MRRVSLKSSLVGGLFAGILAVSSAAHTGVIFTLGNHPEADEENIFFGPVESGPTVHGETNQSHIGVDFSSSRTIYQQGQGQAMIEATDQNPNNVDITNLVITAPGHTFRDFIMNMLNGSGSAIITAMTVASGAFSFDMDLGNGQNYLTVVATDGDMMTSLTIDADGFQQFKQPRISGLTAGQTPVPEPMSAALFLAGLAGLGAMRRKTYAPR